MMLTQFNIEYKLRTMVNGQTLADFIVKCIAWDPELTRLSMLKELWWELATDDALGNKGCGGGGSVLDLLGRIQTLSCLNFHLQPDQ